MIKQGVNGYYTDDMSQMAELVNLASMLDRKIAQAYAEENFSIKKMVDGYLDLYLKIIDESKQGC